MTGRSQAMQLLYYIIIVSSEETTGAVREFYTLH